MSPRTRAPHFLLLAWILAAAAAGQTPFQSTGENVPSGAGPLSAAADLDGDGDLDLAGPGTLLFNDGAGVFSLPPTGVTPPGGTLSVSSVALGDLDGDGDVDALDDLQGQVWLNDGSGNFAPSPVPPPPLPLPLAVLRGHCPILGDVDGDGDLDVFMMTSSQTFHGRLAGPPILWLNNGLAVFTDASTQVPATAPVYGRWPSLVEFFDSDLDGDLDIIAADLGGRRLLINDGTGGFTMGPTLAAGVTWTSGGEIADVDGNGRPDLLFAVGAGDEIWLNTVSGWQLVIGPVVGLGALGYLALDIDGDGDDEVARLDFLGPSLHDFQPGSGLGPPIYRWTGSSTLYDSPGIAADVDGDGDRDLVLGIAGRYRVFLNTGLGTLVEAHGDWPSDVMAKGLAGDVEGDGDLDLVGVRSDGAGNFLLWPVLNDGLGDFSPAAIGGDALPAGLVPHLVDLDGDGDLDIYGASSIYSGTSGNPPTDRFLINTDAGWTLSPTPVPGTGGTFIIKNGDLDSDGDQDIVLARRSPVYLAYPPLPSLVVRNLGGFTFAAPVPLGPALHSFDLALGDVDADGDLDVLEANDLLGGTPGTCALHRNDGTGSFTLDASFPGIAARAVALADLDGDADLDAVQGNAVYMNDGTGTFTFFAAIAIASPWQPMGLMSLADTDLDGDLDIVDGAGRYMTNLGNGSFAASTTIPSGIVFLSWDFPLPRFPLADFDADGDPDLVVRGHLFHNVTRHLARRGVPGPGRTVYLDLWGPASEPYHLFAAGGPGNTPVPPLGTAWLDLASLLLVTSGTLDSAGTATLPLAVPPNHALIGTALHWQAAVGISPALTDRIVTAVLKL